jgi:tetratricopeptide (TPR) repeat protein
MAATQHFLEGLAAYEAGQRDNALEKFDNLEKAWRILPPDLYRLKAEILLPQSPDRAAEECRRALKAEPQHFLAHYVLAMAYRQKGDYENALKELNEALATYKRFPQAERMRRELLAQREKTPS